MLKIKSDCIGKILLKGNERFILSGDLTQAQILYVKNNFSSEFVEEIQEKKEEKKEDKLEVAKKQVKEYTKTKKSDDKDKQELS